DQRLLQNSLKSQANKSLRFTSMESSMSARRRPRQVPRPPTWAVLPILNETETE
ncbi:unnamed protein product, partial [Nesidiocoris tenuis]